MKTKYKILLVLAGVLVLAIISAVKAQETVPQTQSILRSYFLAGDRPTQTNYWEFIDTMFWYANQTYSNAVYAAQQAASVNTLYQASANFQIASSSSVTANIANAYNISSITFSNTGNTSALAFDGGTRNYPAYACNVVFSNALPGVNYTLNFSSPATVVVMTDPDYLTAVKIDGMNTNLSYMHQILTTTNCIFYLFTQTTPNYNGLNIVLTVQ